MGPLLVAALGMLLVPRSAPGRVVERIVAVVNQEIVLQSELEERVRPMMQQIDQIQDESQKAQRLDQLRRQMLDMMIDEKLIVQEANKLKLTVTEADLERAVADVMEKNSLTREELEQALAQEGQTLNAYKYKIVKPQLLRLRVINVQVRSRVSVSDDEVRALYQKNMRALGVETKVRARHIFLQVPAEATPKDEARVKARAEELLARIRGGADFATLAREVSQDPVTRRDGGDLGTFARGTLPSNIEEVVFAMKKNDVRGPLRTDRGYHLVQLLEREESSARSFDEVKDELQNTLYAQKMEKATTAWLAEVRKKAHIDIRL